MIAGVVAPWMALIIIVGIGLGAYYRRRHPQIPLRWPLELIGVVIAVGLILHLVPGFYNPKILDSVRAGPASLPFNLYFNFDKALVPWVLILLVPGLLRTAPGHHAPRWGWLLLGLAVPGLLLVAMGAGGLRLEPHWPAWLGQFVLANVFFVCLAEEALFRGYLQQRLMKRIPASYALIITALIFGLMHCAGGVLMVIFATLAGVIYGLAWLWSGQLWVATGFHFALNCLHLLLFTYPALQHGAGAG